MGELVKIEPATFGFVTLLFRFEAGWPRKAPVVVDPSRVLPPE